MGFLWDGKAHIRGKVPKIIGEARIQHGEKFIKYLRLLTMYIDLLQIQRSSFIKFLQNGINQVFDNINPIIIANRKYIFFSKYYLLKIPSQINFVSLDHQFQAEKKLPNNFCSSVMRNTNISHNGTSPFIFTGFNPIVSVTDNSLPKIFDFKRPFSGFSNRLLLENPALSSFLLRLRLKSHSSQIDGVGLGSEGQGPEMKFISLQTRHSSLQYYSKTKIKNPFNYAETNNLLTTSEFSKFPLYKIWQDKQLRLLRSSSRQFNSEFFRCTKKKIFQPTMDNIMFANKCNETQPSMGLINRESWQNYSRLSFFPWYSFSWPSYKGLYQNDTSSNLSFRTMFKKFRTSKHSLDIQNFSGEVYKPTQSLVPNYRFNTSDADVLLDGYPNVQVQSKFKSGSYYSNRLGHIRLILLQNMKNNHGPTPSLLMECNDRRSLKCTLSFLFQAKRWNEIPPSYGILSGSAFPPRLQYTFPSHGKSKAMGCSLEEEGKNKQHIIKPILIQDYQSLFNNRKKEKTWKMDFIKIYYLNKPWFTSKTKWGRIITTLSKLELICPLLSPPTKVLINTLMKKSLLYFPEWKRVTNVGHTSLLCFSHGRGRYIVNGGRKQSLKRKNEIISQNLFGRRGAGKNSEAARIPPTPPLGEAAFNHSHGLAQKAGNDKNYYLGNQQKYAEKNHNFHKSQNNETQFIRNLGNNNSFATNDLMQTSLLTYSSEFYIPVQIIDQISKKMYLRWLLLADLPIQTKRGHFIINGYPKTVIHQIVRSPGIRFKNEDNQILADIISMRGAWMGIQIQYEKNLKAETFSTKRQKKLLSGSTFSPRLQYTFPSHGKSKAMGWDPNMNKGFPPLRIQSVFFSVMQQRTVNNYLHSAWSGDKSLLDYNDVAYKHKHHQAEFFNSSLLKNSRNLRLRFLPLGEKQSSFYSLFLSGSPWCKMNFTPGKAMGWNPDRVANETRPSNLYNGRRSAPPRMGGEGILYAVWPNKTVSLKSKILGGPFSVDEPMGWDLERKGLFKFPLNTIKESEKMNQTLFVNFFISPSRTDKGDKKKIKLSGFAFLNYLFDLPYFIYNNYVPSSVRSSLFPSSTFVWKEGRGSSSSKSKMGRDSEKKKQSNHERSQLRYIHSASNTQMCGSKILPTLLLGIGRESSLDLLRGIWLFRRMKNNHGSPPSLCFSPQKYCTRWGERSLKRMAEPKTIWNHNVSISRLTVPTYKTMGSNLWVGTLPNYNFASVLKKPSERVYDKTIMTKNLENTKRIKDTNQLLPKFFNSEAIPKFAWTEKSLSHFPADVLVQRSWTKRRGLPEGRGRRYSSSELLFPADVPFEQDILKGNLLLNSIRSNENERQAFDFRKKRFYKQNLFLASLVYILNTTNFRDILFERFMNAKFYDIGLMGRKRLNKKLRLNIPLQCTTLTPLDFLAVFYKLFSLYNNFSLIQNYFPINQPSLGEPLNSSSTWSFFNPGGAFSSGSMALRENQKKVLPSEAISSPGTNNVLKPRNDILNRTIKQTASLDHLNQRHIRTCGEFLFLQFWRAILRFYQVLRQLSTRSNFIKSSYAGPGKTGRNFFSLSSISLFPNVNHKFSSSSAVPPWRKGKVHFTALSHKPELAIKGVRPNPYPFLGQRHPGWEGKLYCKRWDPEDSLSVWSKMNSKLFLVSQAPLPPLGGKAKRWGGPQNNQIPPGPHLPLPGPTTLLRRTFSPIPRILGRNSGEGPKGKTYYMQWDPNTYRQSKHLFEPAFETNSNLKAIQLNSDSSLEIPFNKGISTNNTSQATALQKKKLGAYPWNKPQHIVPITDSQTQILKAWGYSNSISTQKLTWNSQFQLWTMTPTLGSMYQRFAIPSSLSQTLKTAKAGFLYSIATSLGSEWSRTGTRGWYPNNTRNDTIGVVINRNDINSIFPYTPYLQNQSQFNIKNWSNQIFSSMTGFSYEQFKAQSFLKHDNANISNQALLGVKRQTNQWGGTQKKNVQINFAKLQNIALKHHQAPLFSPAYNTPYPPMEKAKQWGGTQKIRNKISKTNSHRLVTATLPDSYAKNTDTIIKKLLYESKELRVFDPKDRMRNLETKLFNGVFKEFFNLDPLSQDWPTERSFY